MDGFHVTRDLLRAIQESKLPARHLVELAWKHLLEVCPHCRMEWEAWVEERREVREPSYDAAFSSAQVNTGAVRGEEEKERQRAQRDFRDLLALPHDRRRQKIHRANQRFKGAVCRRSQGGMAIRRDGKLGTHALSALCTCSQRKGSCRRLYGKCFARR